MSLLSRMLGKIFTPTLVFLISYLAGAELGNALRFDTAFTEFSPTAGIYLAALLVAPPRTWKTIIALACLGQVISDVGLHGFSLWSSLCLWFAYTVSAVLGTLFLRGTTAKSYTLVSLSDLSRLCVGAGAGATAAGAFIGAAVLSRSFGVDYWIAWLMWWTGAMIGVIVTTPLFLQAAQSRRSREPLKGNQYELIVALSVLMVLSSFVFQDIHRPAWFFTIPIMLWIIVRCELHGVVLANLVLTCTTFVPAAIHFQNTPPGMVHLTDSLFIQAFAAIATGSSLILAGLLSDRRRALEALQLHAEFSRELLENMNDLAMRVSRHGRILEVNPAWRSTLGYSAKEASGLTLQDLIHPDDSPLMNNQLKRILQGDKIELTEVRFLTRNGDPVYVEGNSSCLADEGDEMSVFIVYRDITNQTETQKQSEEYQRQLETMNAKLRSLSITDALTKLYNRRYFQQQLLEEMERSNRYGMSLSLLMLDVDHFKRFNDTYGHPAGDAVLCNVAQILKDNARASDVVARIGGEEFAVILPITDTDGAVALAERFREAIQSGPWFSTPVTVSIGVATTVAGFPNYDDLILLADDALYQSKQNGRNCVSASSPTFALRSEGF